MESPCVLEPCIVACGSWTISGSQNQFNGSQTTLKWNRIEKKKHACDEWVFLRGQTFVSVYLNRNIRGLTILPDSRNKSFAALSPHRIVLIQSSCWLCKQFRWFHRMLWLWVGKPAMLLFRNVLCKHYSSQSQFSRSISSWNIRDVKNGHDQQTSQGDLVVKFKWERSQVLTSLDLESCPARALLDNWAR